MKENSTKVLVVDDEPNIVELLTVSLKFQGFEVATATSGLQALEVAPEFKPDAFILDVMMPGMDGFELLPKLRALGFEGPVLFLTAKDAVEHRIHGLTIGADDYVTKPFSLEEVITRLRVILRRGAQVAEEVEDDNVLTYDDLVLNDDTHEVTKGGTVVELSPTEFNLLRYLMLNAEVVLSKPKILDNVWHYDFGGDGNVVESYISYLRRKIDTGDVPLIHTVRGVGYVLRKPRVSLLFVTVIVAGVGLLASAVAIQQAMYEVAFSRVDEDLEWGLKGWARNEQLYQYDDRYVSVLPSDFFVYRLYKEGEYRVQNGYKEVSLPAMREIQFDGKAHTVKSQDGQTDWRVLAGTYEDSIIVIGKQVRNEQILLNKLVAGQIRIGIAVLFLIGVLGYFVIRRTLGPLRKVEETAKAIANGDLDRRAPVLPENTEVGALSHSMNVMLEQLQASIVELQSKETQMRRFLGDASHELRTPLTSVKGYAELYRSGATTDATMVMKKIEEEAARMSLLVEDLLSLTRSEEARFDEAPVDMLALGLSVVGSLRAAYPERSIEVDAKATDMPMVMGDTARLHQVLTNLIVNSLKHGGEEAKARLSIDTDDNHVILEVSDDGVGVQEADLPHIFERFYRADTSRTRATGGSGLGLAIVKTIVEAHQGAISVESTVGEGTSFRIVLPKLAS